MKQEPIKQIRCEAGSVILYAVHGLFGWSYVVILLQGDAKRTMTTSDHLTALNTFDQFTTQLRELAQ